jgi:hypothetical protein
MASLTPQQRAKERIAVLKRELAETDYIAAKIAEEKATGRFHMSAMCHFEEKNKL